MVAKYPFLPALKFKMHQKVYMVSKENDWIPEGAKGEIVQIAKGLAKPYSVVFELDRYEMQEGGSTIILHRLFVKETDLDTEYSEENADDKSISVPRGITGEQHTAKGMGGQNTQRN